MGGSSQSAYLDFGLELLSTFQTAMIMGTGFYHSASAFSSYQ